MSRATVVSVRRRRLARLVGQGRRLVQRVTMVWRPQACGREQPALRGVTWQVDGLTHRPSPLKLMHGDLVTLLLAMRLRQVVMVVVLLGQVQGLVQVQGFTLGLMPGLLRLALALHGLTLAQGVASPMWPSPWMGCAPLVQELVEWHQAAQGRHSPSSCDNAPPFHRSSTMPVALQQAAQSRQLMLVPERAGQSPLSLTCLTRTPIWPVTSRSSTASAR